MHGLVDFRGQEISQDPGAIAIAQAQPVGVDAEVGIRRLAVQVCAQEEEVAGAVCDGQPEVLLRHLQHDVQGKRPCNVRMCVYVCNVCCMF